MALRIINDKPVIDWQIEFLRDHVGKIIIATNCVNELKTHLKDSIECVIFCEERGLLGTAGALKNALKLIDRDCEFVIVCNVDDITNIDLFALKNINENAICVANPRMPFGITFLDETGYEIKEFKEKPIINNVWANCGVYMFKAKEIKRFLPNTGSLERDVFPFMKNLRVLKHRGFWKTFKLLV